MITIDRSDSSPDPKTNSPAEPSRRDTLRGLGVAGITALAGSACASSDDPDPGDLGPDAGDIGNAMCLAMPEQTSGPFYFDAGQVRRDITEGKPGSPLRVVLRIVEAGTCTPIPDAVVDIWHNDAQGLYSGYPGQGDDGTIDTSGQSFLRGVQITDTDGMIEVATIYPGWYPGRAVHIHIKVHLDATTVLTSQLYFPEAITSQVYQLAPYLDRGLPDTANSADFIFRASGGGQGITADVVADGDGHLASLTIAVANP